MFASIYRPKHETIYTPIYARIGLDTRKQRSRASESFFLMAPRLWPSGGDYLSSSIFFNMFRRTKVRCGRYVSEIDEAHESAISEDLVEYGRLNDSRAMDHGTSFNSANELRSGLRERKAWS